MVRSHSRSRHESDFSILEATVTMIHTIDLRSDTVTKPTPGMRQAMAEAEVGDAVADIDPTTDRLEKRVAELLGKEAGLFVPSGTMANQIALRVHCPAAGSEFLAEAESHILHYEQGAFAALSGLVPHPIATEDASIRADQVVGRIQPDNEHFPRTRLVCIENTHNRWGGRIQNQSDVVEVCGWAKTNGLATHLDGARLWNASVATGASLDSLSAPFDSVNVCFSKGLGAPVGSLLAGSREFVAEAKRHRKLLGGGMRQSGIIAAGALHAVEHHVDRLSEDHAHAQQLADAITAVDGFAIRGGNVDTNIVIVEMEHGGASEFVASLADKGLLCYDVAPNRFRMVTHLDVTAEQIQQACEILCDTAQRCLQRVTL
ncbi:MAG: GntG family PLP-dependent aldolase [Planctomycetota bacterium]